MTKQEAKYIRVIGHILFVIYIICLMYFLLFSDSLGRNLTDRKYQYNLVLFKEIRRFLRYYKELGMLSVVLNLAGNVVGFIPFGYILPIISKKRRRFSIILCLSFELSLFIEVTQLIFRVGSFDVDDLLLNTMGGIIGYFGYLITNRLRRKYYG